MTEIALTISLRRILGPRDTFAEVEITPDERRPGWCWIRVGQLKLLVRPYSEAEMQAKGRRELFGFAVCRVLGPLQRRAVVAREMSQSLQDPPRP